MEAIIFDGIEGIGINFDGIEEQRVPREHSLALLSHEPKISELQLTQGIALR